MDIMATITDILQTLQNEFSNNSTVANVTAIINMAVVAGSITFAIKQKTELVLLRFGITKERQKVEAYEKHIKEQDMKYNIMSQQYTLLASMFNRAYQESNLGVDIKKAIALDWAEVVALGQKIENPMPEVKEPEAEEPEGITVPEVIEGAKEIVEFTTEAIQEGKTYLEQLGIELDSEQK